MKKLLSLSLVFIFSTLSGQVNFETNKSVITEGAKYYTGTYEYLNDFTVIETPGTPEELYNKALGWINETYNTPDEVIKGNIENEYIRFQGVTNEIIHYVKILGIVTPYTPSRYMIELRFKEGRFKFELIEFEFYNQGSQYSAPGFIKGSFGGRIANKKGKEDKGGVKSVQAKKTYFSSLALALKSYMENGESKDSDDW